jgi:ABC-type sugar transport system ATPase subunit
VSEQTELSSNGYAARPLLEVRGATKRFGFVSALDDVSLALNRGEILALLGDNGAGKSTLVKCLTGVYTFDEGQILLDSEEVVIRDPRHAQELGIETVYQDLALFDNLTAAANFYAGRELAGPRWLGRLGFLRRRAMRRHTEEVLKRLRVGVHDPDTLIGLMSGGQRQAVAVARAEAFARRIIILDEPTAALGVRESRAVLDIIKRLPERGLSVIIISHNLEHVTEVCDRAVVFRQGKKVGEASATSENHELLVSMIVGSEADLGTNGRRNVRKGSDGE